MTEEEAFALDEYYTNNPPKIDPSKARIRIPLMNKEKQFDCVRFKNELQENLLKKSGAKNLQEYVEYANKAAQTSSLHKVNQQPRA